MERLEQRVLLAADLAGIDARSQIPTAYFNVQQDTVYWGDQIDLTFAILNFGDAASTGQPYEVGFYVSDNANIDDGNDSQIAQTTLIVPGAGSGSPFAGSITLPSVNPIGGSNQYYVGMVLDITNVIPESNESNNKNQGQFIDLDMLTILDPEPDIVLSETTLDFDRVVDDGTGNSLVSRTLEISNAGQTELAVSQNGITFSDGSHFQLGSIISSTDGGTEVDLTNGSSQINRYSSESWLVEVLFDPTATGTLNDTLTIASDDPNDPSVVVQLTGIGDPQPDIAVADLNDLPNDLLFDFGSFSNDGVGGATTSTTIDITNPGSGPLTIEQDGVTASGAPFSITGITSSTQGAISLGAGPATIAEDDSETWTVTVVFDPANNGLVSGSLTILSDDHDEATTTVTLLGTGRGPQNIVALDSVGADNDLAMDFGGVHADGSGQQQQTQTVTLTNDGELPLTILQNGIHLATGTQFSIDSVTSSTQGLINLTAGPVQLAPFDDETWTVVILFDPTTADPFSDTLRVDSNDPDTPQLQVALSGTGLDEADIEVTDSSGPDSDLTVSFQPTLNDGANGESRTETVEIRNVGTQLLTVAQNGIGLTTGTDFHIVSIVSSVTGAVDLSFGADSIDPQSAEVWTVTVEFDPTSTASLADTLTITSDDADEATVNVQLDGEGVVPSITVDSPAQPINVSALRPYQIEWTDTFTAGDASISLFYDTDTNPASGLMQIASGLSEDSLRDHYNWQVPVSLVGSTVTIYAVIDAAGVSSGMYAAGTLTVDPANTHRLLSAPIVDTADYTLRYEYEGTERTQNFTLQLGENLLYPTTTGTSGQVTHEFRITRVPTLVDAEFLEYDELGNVTASTDSNGNRTEFVYDDQSQVVQISLADGTVSEFAYDASGSLTSMHDTTGYQLYEYDNLDRLTSVTYSEDDQSGDPSDLTISYEYDSVDRLTAIDYPGGKRIEYGYDAVNRLTTVTDVVSGGPNLVTTYTYDVVTGLLSETTLPNDVETIYTYDTSGRLTDVLHQRTSTAALITHYHYDLDSSGRRTKMEVATAGGTRAEAYRYDAFDRLDQVTYSVDATIDPTDRVVTYTYDTNGNRLSLSDDVDGTGATAPVVQTYEYSFENRLGRVTNQNTGDVTEYFYDARGNQVMRVTSGETTHYAYDGLNRLTGVTDSDGFAEYSYDAAGRRLSQIVNGVETQFVVDPSNAIYQTIEERNAAGAVTADYTYGLQRLAGVLAGESASTFYLHDALGSTGALTDDTGGLRGVYEYDAFGTLAAPAPVAQNPFGFTGERLDAETDLIYLRARQYDAGIGRFTAKDPLGLIDGPNQYVYVSNLPTFRTDPSGMIGVDEVVDYLREFTDPANARIDVGIGGSVPLLPNGSGRTSVQITGDGIVTLEGRIGQDVPIPTPVGVINTGYRIDPVTGNATPRVSYGIPNVGSVSLSTLGGIDNTRIGLGVGPLRFGANPQAIVQNSPIGTILQTGIAIYDAFNQDSVSSTPTQSFDGLESGFLNDSRLPTFFPPGGGGGPDLGGVLIDKSVQFVGSNLSNIAGASFDPVSNQLIFLGENDPGALTGIDPDLFFTAIVSTFGSTVPPFVTLDPPAKLIQDNFNVGDGDGVLVDGNVGPIGINYTPFSATHADDLTLTFEINGSPVTATIDAQVLDGTLGNSTVTAGGRSVMVLKLGTVSGLPAGVTLSAPTLSGLFTGGGTITVGGTLTVFDGSGYTLVADARGQNSNFFFTIQNESGVTQTVTNVQLAPDLQHRKFGGRIDDTMLGWILYEADRVAKALAIGKDHHTGVIYDSSNTNLPAGFRSVVERLVDAGSTGQLDARIWLSPNELTLKRFIDPDTGQATVMFDEASVLLQTESRILGVPGNIQAQEFVEFFNTHYDEFADIAFPVQDPDDPTGNTIISVKIFEELRDAMKAVSLARFFRDNNVPIDTWWLNSYEPEQAWIPETIPTLTNSHSNGTLTLTLQGGVQLYLPNAYLPDAVAESLASQVVSQRPDQAGDLDDQVWSVTGTPMGSFDAAATSLDADEQDASVRLGATDLVFASPGDQSLSFDRFYDSAFLGAGELGRGWQAARFALQFQYPSWTDQFGLMRDAGGDPIEIFGADFNTRLRSGEIRFIDHATGQILDFDSSLEIAYDVDSYGNPIVATSGLDASDLPTLSMGRFRDGSTLSQDSGNHQYTLTRPDGSSLVFDPDGRLLSVTDRLGKTIDYDYTDEQLTSISDSAGQQITIEYDSNDRVQFVSGPEPSLPATRRIEYVYTTGGLLEEVRTQAHQGGGTYNTVRTVSYQYNADDQLISVTGPDGLVELDTSPDLRGRSSMRQDTLGNMADFAFALDTADDSRATTVTDMGALGSASETDHGILALQYFASGSSSMREFDGSDRLMKTMDALGNVTELGYDADSLFPNQVMLPTPGRAAIDIDRNAFGLPTTITDPANTQGTPIEIQYNAANLPTRTIDAEGIITDLTYTAENNVETITRGVGTAFAATTSFFYNGDGLLERIENPLSQTIVTYAYDSIGRVQSVTDGTGVTTTYEYDALSRLTKVFDPRLTGATDFIQYDYNDNDQLTQVTTPTGTIQYQYDAVTNRLTDVTDQNGDVTEYDYDAATGELTSVTQVDAGGNAETQYLYDRLGNLTLLTAPEGTRTAFRYDELGRQTAMIDDDGAAPDGEATGRITSATEMTVTVDATEEILVASLTYWLDGQPMNTGTTLTQRPGDLSSFNFDLSGLDTGLDYRYQLELTDRVGLTTTTAEQLLDAVVGTVEGRHLFYNTSGFDAPGPIGNPALNADDDGAIATDKSALVAGELADFSNYSGYTRGINGIMIDIANAAGTLTPADFQFAVGNTATPGSWIAAPAHSDFSIREGAGENGSDRVSFSWIDGAIRNQWLQVTVLANENTGLLTPDVHYWGNQVGETGNSPTTSVDGSDVGIVVNNPSGFTPADVSNPYDVNKSGFVDGADVGAVVNSPSGFSSLLLWTPVAPPPAPEFDTLAAPDVADSRSSVSDAPEFVQRDEIGVLRDSVRDAPVIIQLAAPSIDASDPGDPQRIELHARTDFGTISLAGEFQAGLPSSATVYVDWGDGSGVDIVTMDRESGRTFDAQHFYTTGGTFLVTVSWFDENGQELSAQTTAVVSQSEKILLPGPLESGTQSRQPQFSRVDRDDAGTSGGGQSETSVLFSDMHGTMTVTEIPVSRLSGPVNLRDVDALDEDTDESRFDRRRLGGWHVFDEDSQRRRFRLTGRHRRAR